MRSKNSTFARSKLLVRAAPLDTHPFAYLTRWVSNCSISGGKHRFPLEQSFSRLRLARLRAGVLLFRSLVKSASKPTSAVGGCPIACAALDAEPQVTPTLWDAYPDGCSHGLGYRHLGRAAFDRHGPRYYRSRYWHAEWSCRAGAYGSSVWKRSPRAFIEDVVAIAGALLIVLAFSS